jgi:hypothetical protein
MRPSSAELGVVRFKALKGDEVGASWGGTEHQDKRFGEQGYLMLRWKEEKQPEQYEKAAEMKVGDRIAN